jgi:hypothetical protein
MLTKGPFLVSRLPFWRQNPKVLHHHKEQIGVRFGLKVEESKAIPLSGHGGPQCSETSRFPHSLDQRWKTGGPRLDLLRTPPSLRLILKKFLTSQLNSVFNRTFH